MATTAAATLVLSLALTLIVLLRSPLAMVRVMMATVSGSPPMAARMLRMVSSVTTTPSTAIKSVAVMDRLLVRVALAS